MTLMTALDKGMRAPEFTLSRADGKSSVTLKGLLDGKGAVLAFFKKECPTCQLEFPFVERMAKALKGKGVHLLGIGQNPAGDVRAFAKDHGCTFPMATDAEPYATSAAYGLTHVPTLFLVDPEGKIRRTEIGFSKASLEAFLKEASGLAGATAPPLFRPTDDAPDTQPG